MGSYIGSGVKYIKIARYDAFGNDNYQSLRQLDNIRINTVDRGIIDYPVATITEYPSSSLNGPYFLYQIVTTDITSSTNNQILNYQVSASSAGPISNQFLINPATEIGTKVTGYTENIDSQNYFDPTNGNYVLGNTPNIPLIFTASCTFNYAGAPFSQGTVYLDFVQGNSYLGRIKLVSGSGLSGTGTLSMSGSFTPIENQTYSLYVGTGGDTMNFTNIDLKITQSITPQAGIGAQTILEPYITTPFINSDYDVLMNNAVINRPNSLFLDVDFADSQILPINQQAILSGSATPAVIQDSYYSSNWWASSRYNGQQLFNQKYNVWSQGDFTPDKVSNVQNLKTYFVRFNWLAGTSPEWGNNFKGKTNVSIKYIIDENGNEIPPIFDENDINLSIIQSAFGGYYNPGGINPTANATLLLSNPDSFGVNLDAVNYTIPVFRAGQRIRPIAYTQTASYDSNGNVTGFGYTGSINFVQGDTPNDPGGSANDYRLLAFANDGLNLFSSDTISATSNVGLIKFNPPIQLGSSASFATSSATPGPSTGSIYKPTGSLAQLSGSGYVLNLKAYIDVDYNLRNISRTDDDVSFAFKIMKDGSVLTDDSFSLKFTKRNDPQISSRNITLNYTDYSATTSSLYSVAYEFAWYKNDTIDGAVNIRNTSYFQVTQYPAPNTGPVKKFWMTGSNSNLLFARRGEDLNEFGLNDVWGQKQQNINNSGFDPIVYDFEPQTGDEIRFEGVEQQTYTITQVSQSVTQSGAGTGNYNALTLTLDRQISNNINTDYFLIRRYIPDPGNIILDISKPAGQTSDGILIPEFLGEKATETKEKIISLLRTQS
jgi:Flp pilus assembly protein TadG